MKKWNMSGKLLKTMLGCITGVTAIQVSTDDKKIFVSSESGLILVWDLDGNLIKKIEAVEHYGRCLAIALSLDNRYLISGGEDGLIKIWDTETFKLIKIIKAAVDKPVNTVAFSPDGKYIVSTSNDSTMRVWSFEGQEICLLFDSYNNPNKINLGSIIYAIFSDNNTIISGHEEGKVGIWNLDGKLLKKDKFKK